MKAKELRIQRGKTSLQFGTHPVGWSLRHSASLKAGVPDRKEHFLSQRKYTVEVRVGWPSLAAQMVKTLPAMQENWVRSLGWEDPWRNTWQLTPIFLPGESPWTEEPGGPQSIGSQRVGHD